MFNLTKKPLRIAIAGWLVYAAMLIAVGVLWYLIGIRHVLRKENKGHARGAVLTGLAPIVFLGIFYLTTGGL